MLVGDAYSNGESGHDSGVVEKKANIDDLPVEVLINIFSKLDLEQLGDLRTVCKKWNYAIMDKSTWSSAFSSKFGTTRSFFPSLTGSKYWIVEYIRRLKVYKKWNKAAAVHVGYQLINNEFYHIDRCLVNFQQGRILTSSRLLGNVSVCNLDNGRNQVFIPGSYLFSEISSYSVNWGFMLIGKVTGELYLKNLFTSVSTSGKLSLTKLLSSATNDSITATELNQNAGKPLERYDCISGSLSGRLIIWDSKGKVAKEYKLEKIIMNIKSDFKTMAVIQTKDSVCFVSLKDYTVKEFPLDFDIKSDFDCFFDVDFGDSYAILSYNIYIRSFNFSDLNKITARRMKNLDNSSYVLNARMQTTCLRRRSRRDPSIAGGDGILYANVLADDSVVVWNVRDFGIEIVPQCRIYPTFHKRAPELPEGVPAITAIALNSSIIAVGGYNGFANLYNVFTGEFFKDCSAKLPKKLAYGSPDLIPISSIQLNEDQYATNGVIVSGHRIQYFQVGDDNLPKSRKSNFKAKVNNGSLNKNDNYNQIRDGLEEYECNQEAERKRNLLFDKYNGSSNEEEDELSIALALSESYQQKNTDDEELKAAIELSKSRDNFHPSNLNKSYHESSTIHHDQRLIAEEDEDVKRILELSLIEQ